MEGNDEISVEKVTRSSKACGPLYQWAESQIKYSSIYNSIQPLREEVEQLEKDAAVANEQKDKLESEVAQRNHPSQTISLNMPLSSETLKL